MLSMDIKQVEAPSTGYGEHSHIHSGTCTYTHKPTCHIPSHPLYPLKLYRQTDPHTKMSLIVLKGNHFLLYLSDSDQLLLTLQLILEGEFVGLLFRTPLLKNTGILRMDRYTDTCASSYTVGNTVMIDTWQQLFLLVILPHIPFLCALYYPLHAIWDTLIS